MQLTSPRLNRSARKAFLQGYNDPEIFEWLDGRLEQGMTFFDVGANVGLYALFAAKRVGASGRVIAFEADPEMASYLESNRLANGMTNLRVVTCAVGEEPGMLTFRQNRKNRGASHVAEDGGPGGTAVPVITLDQFCTSENIERVDFAKLDLEGYEVQALRGAGQMLASNPDAVLITEVSRKHLARYGHTPNEIQALIEGHGFRGFLLFGTELAPYDFSWNSADVIWMRQEQPYSFQAETDPRT
jgi:FkbM family methyltransferase